MMRPVETEDAARDVCPSCRNFIHWTAWRAYPPPWTGAQSRGDVRSGNCACGEKRYFATRLPQQFFRALRR